VTYEDGKDGETFALARPEAKRRIKALQWERLSGAALVSVV
jgi:hypothetical protein